jgi:hypothetical protein
MGLLRYTLKERSYEEVVSGGFRGCCVWMCRGGPKSTDFGMVGGVQMSATPEEYKRLLDLIESGLLSE